MSGGEWRPAPAAGLRVGPARWDGARMVTDASCDGHERILTLGLRERMVLELVDGERSPGAIAAELAGQGTPLPPAALTQILNGFVMHGLLERPFAVETAGVARADRDAATAPATRPEVWAGAARRRDPLGMLAAAPAMAVLGVAAAAGIAAAVFALPAAWAAVTSGAAGAWLVAAILAAVAWTGAVTWAHEAAHAAVFRRLSGRAARLSITMLGVVPMPNTQLAGLALLSPGRRARVVAAGPLVSLAAMLVPAAVFAADPAGPAGLAAAAAVVLGAAVNWLSLSFFPNTDATRLLEVAGSVDQVQAVAFRALVRPSSIPRALPGAAKTVIRAYPFLLAASVLATAALSVPAIRSVLP
ncbi:hypothetical protein [Agromyces archimandritae]|uniref:Uncharacterized protein n=1 Tax=Agromyces archimandritae TaxID=2781962 RepID=A0A975IPJ4_9MICO|nr:hypothetical protein [Agromyces archimandritae]QTX04071.1 hypothetical protein G127AT_12320 [Agromyces archimandritae]